MDCTRAQIVSLLVLLAAATAKIATSSANPSTKNLNVHEVNRPLESVDPNSLSCDPAGKIFLLLPSYTSCNKFFSCDFGKEVEFTCDSPLIFDFVVQTCNWPSATKCVLRKPKDEIEGSGMSEGEIGTFGEEIDNGPVGFLTAESSARSRPVSAIASQKFNKILDCNEAGSAAKQVAYKGDCQRYWKCIGPVAQAVYCSDGLFFNEATSQCDHEGNVKCTVQPEDELNGEFIVYK